MNGLKPTGPKVPPLTKTCVDYILPTGTVSTIIHTPFRPS